MAQRRLADWIQAAGTLGLVVSLILVAMQLRDANRIASAQMFSASVDTVIAVNLAQLGESPHDAMGRVLYEPVEATREDYYIADRIYDALFRALVRIHVLDGLGLYGSEEVDPRGFVLTHYQAFACPYGLAWLDLALTIYTDNAPDPDAVPVIASLKRMRQLAASNPALTRMSERERRVASLISTVRTLTEERSP